MKKLVLFIVGLLIVIPLNCIPQKTSVFEDCNFVRVSGQSNKSVSQETEVKISGDISDADFNIGLYAQEIDSTVGYKYGIKWGMSKSEVEKCLPSGEKLQKVDKSKYPDTTNGYVDSVEVYTQMSKKDSDVFVVTYYFLDGKLFQVVDMLKKKSASEQKLKARYKGLKKATGNFDYWDRSVAADGYITMSVGVKIFTEGKGKGMATAVMYDWETYKKATTLEVQEYVDVSVGA